MPDRATPGQTITSPSGKFVLIVTQPDPARADVLSFRLEDPAHHPVFTAAEHWSDRHRLHFAWDASDRAWCYSSDVGTDVWERQVDGSWLHRAWVDTQLVPPEALQPFVRRR